MSHKHHDYTKHSKVQETPVEPAVPEEVAEGQTDYILGVVTECVKLNVRTEPDPEADIITTIPIGTEVQVDIFESTKEFYKICMGAGIEGYCMTDYINID